MGMSKQARMGKDNMKSWSMTGKDTAAAKNEGGKGKGSGGAAVSSYFCDVAHSALYCFVPQPESALFN